MEIVLNRSKGRLCEGTEAPFRSRLLDLRPKADYYEDKMCRKSPCQKVHGELCGLDHDMSEGSMIAETFNDKKFSSIQVLTQCHKTFMRPFPR